MGGVAEKNSAKTARRTQAERTAETRTKIMDAVVASIADIGFKRTTAVEITRRAGVTWGAVQHQFGDKDGILRAVLQESFDRFAARLADMPEASAPLDDRIDAFLDRAWSHFGSADYRSTFEILLQHESAPAGETPNWKSGMADSWVRIWSSVFPARPEGHGSWVPLYTVTVLSGMATLDMMGSPNPTQRRAELALLKETLLRHLK